MIPASYETDGGGGGGGDVTSPVSLSYYRVYIQSVTQCIHGDRKHTQRPSSSPGVTKLQKYFV